MNRKANARVSSVIEMLESRQLMSVTYGANLISNPGAETYSGTANGTNIITPTGWTKNSDPTVAPYSAGRGSSPQLPAPANSGKVYFSGGPDTQETDFFQTIDLTTVGSAIDTGQVKYSLSADLGGFGSDIGNATVYINFSSKTTFLSQVNIGPVTAANRSDHTGMILKSLTGTVPETARSAQIQINFQGDTTGSNDGIADNLSLILNGPASSVTGQVYNDTNGNGKIDSGETGLGGVKVFVDKNNNGTLDSGEPSATTSSSGNYTITGLTAGTYSLREIVPSGYRATTANPKSITIASGNNSGSNNFLDSQTVLISGNVFNDANGNKKKDTGETGLAGVVVYLDFNNNSQLDSFELKTTTDSSGNYSFVVPFGTYVIRQVLPSGYKQTTAPSAITLALGAVSANDNFGDQKT